MKPSLWARYIMERDNKNMLEEEYGFATYYFIDEIVYLEDIYVTPEMRKTYVASQLADKVADKAREAGCKRMLGSVKMIDKSRDRNIKVLMNYGMKLDSSNEHMLYFIKDI